jgi:hypothetical protein
MKGRILVNHEDYHNLRKRLTKVISKINSVANIDGKGRDDLNYEILEASEHLINTITGERSRAARSIAVKIRNSFISLR